MKDIALERVEELRALDNIGAIIDERVHAMLSHSSVYSGDREAAQMRAEAERLAEDMACVRAILDDYSRLEATLKAELKRSEAYARDAWKADAEVERLQAELADLKKKYEGAKALLFGEKSLEAELAAAKPLIEAAMGTDLHQNGPDAREPGKVWIAKAEHHQPLLHAALAYRRAKEATDEAK